MKSSLMVSSDKRCTRQKSNQLKCFKKWGREVKKKEMWVTRNVTSKYLCDYDRESKLYECVCVMLCMSVGACMSGFAYLVHYQFWLQSFPVHWVRYQSCDLPGGSLCCKNRLSCIIWAVCCGWVQYWASNAFQLCSRQPDHLHQQTWAPTHSSLVYKVDVILLSQLPCSFVFTSSIFCLFYYYFVLQ